MPPEDNSSAITHTNNRGKKWLKDNGYPYTDYEYLQKSTYTFSNGEKIGIEIPLINSFDILKKTIGWLEKFNVHCNRFNETKGNFLLSDTEIKDMLYLCAEQKIGMLFSLSARPEYDVKSSFYRSNFGLEQGRRLNNIEAIAYSIEETLRLAELGCRGIIVYDIGVLSLLSEMRKKGALPQEMIFKASSHCMATNPMIAKILHQNGADSVTVAHDTNLTTLQGMRTLCPKLILDIPIDVYADKGGYIRFNEIAEIAQISSPVFLKLGASAQSNPYDAIDDGIIKNRIYRASVAIQHLQRTLGEYTSLNPNNKYCCLPKL